MKRLFLFVAVAFAAAFAVGLSPAAAQTDPYGEPPENCDASTDSCTPAADATASQESAEPGDEVTVGTDDGTFAPGSTADVLFAPVGEGDASLLVDNVTVNPDGSVSATVTVPEGTADGVYILYIHGEDANGNPVVAIVPIVIEGGAQSASTGSVAAAGVTPPPQVQALQASMSTGAAADAAEAVSAGDGELVVNGNAIEVRASDSVAAPSQRSLSTTGTNVAGPITAGIALILAGAGLVILRRRQAVEA